MDTCTFDVVVIGAGPAGSRAASRIAGAGRRVLLLEKRERIGFPVRCAEAVGPREDVERYLTLDDSLVSSPIHGVLVASPGGERFESQMRDIGFIIDRELFDRRLAEAAGRNGAEVRTGHQAVRLLTGNGRIHGVTVRECNSGAEYDVRSSVVVGADGIEALSPRWAGLKHSFRPDEIFSCAQKLVSGLDIPRPFMEFHLGERFAPGGYAWVFPKGGDRANVGVGVNPSRARGKTAVDYLEEFISHRCPGGTRHRLIGGGCSVARGLPTLATDGYVVVGEAGHQNNPFSGGGIINALEGADMAAETITAALDSGDVSKRSLDAYSRSWKKAVGRTNDTFYRAARIFYSLPDGEMDGLIRKLIRTPGIVHSKGVNPSRMVLAIMMHRPSLVFKLFGSLFPSRR